MCEEEEMKRMKMKKYSSLLHHSPPQLKHCPQCVTRYHEPYTGNTWVILTDHEQHKTIHKQYMSKHEHYKAIMSNTWAIQSNTWYPIQDPNKYNTTATRVQACLKWVWRNARKTITSSTLWFSNSHNRKSGEDVIPAETKIKNSKHTIHRYKATQLR